MRFVIKSNSWNSYRLVLRCSLNNNAGSVHLMQVVAEIVGTFILMFCTCGIIAITQTTRGDVGLLEYAATAGLTVIVVIFSIGSISGAHVNPAVTLALAIFGHFPWPRVLLDNSLSSHFEVLLIKHRKLMSFPYFSQGPALHICTNVRLNHRNICREVCLRRKIRTHAHPAATRLRLSLLGRGHGNFCYHVLGSLINSSSSICKETPLNI